MVTRRVVSPGFPCQGPSSAEPQDETVHPGAGAPKTRRRWPPSPTDFAGHRAMTRSVRSGWGERPPDAT